MSLSLEQRAFLAKLAYEPDQGVIYEQLQILFHIGPKDIEFLYVARTDTEGALFRLGDTCVMIWPGTESLVDLRQDLLFLPSEYYEGWLHMGFNQIFGRIDWPVRAAFANLCQHGGFARVESIGHSLGAQVAMGAMDVLYYAGHRMERKITTFGCPNGWSRKARAGFNSRHQDVTNYINHGDYVTWAMGIASGRPGKDIKLSGKWGHKMDKYVANVKRFE